MTNVVNRHLDGPPTQGRRKECTRRQRQLLRKQFKQVGPALEARVEAKFQRLVDAIAEFPPEVVQQLSLLDDAQCGFLEGEIARADAEADAAQQAKSVPDRSVEAYAQAVLDALQDRR